MADITHNTASAIVRILQSVWNIDLPSSKACKASCLLFLPGACHTPQPVGQRLSKTPYLIIASKFHAMLLYTLAVLARILHKDLCSNQKEGSSSISRGERRHAVMVKKVT